MKTGENRRKYVKSTTGENQSRGDPDAAERVLE
jgi:hypothetical protein